MRVPGPLPDDHDRRLVQAMDINPRSRSHAATRSARRTGRVRASLRALTVAAAAQVRFDLSRRAMNVRVLHRLSMMSDRELKGIGLVRRDVVDAALPPCDDAVHLLLERRETRRIMRWIHRAG